MPSYNFDPLIPYSGAEANLPASPPFSPLIAWTTDTYGLWVYSGGAWRLAGSSHFASLFGGSVINQPTIGNEVINFKSTATNDDPDFAIIQARVQTTDATPTTLWTETPADDKVSHYRIHVTSRETAGAGAGMGGAWEAIYALQKSSGTATAIYSTSQGSGFGAWSISLSIASNIFYLKVTGAASETITWHATIFKHTVGT